jgi:hypothetical protein
MLKPSISSDSIRWGCRRFISFMAYLGPFFEGVDEMMAVIKYPTDSFFGWLGKVVSAPIVRRI